MRRDRNLDPRRCLRPFAIPNTAHRVVSIDSELRPPRAQHRRCIAEIEKGEIAPRLRLRLPHTNVLKARGQLLQRMTVPRRLVDRDQLPIHHQRSRKLIQPRQVRTHDQRRPRKRPQRKLRPPLILRQPRRARLAKRWMWPQPSRRQYIPIDPAPGLCRRRPLREQIEIVAAAQPYVPSCPSLLSRSPNALPRIATPVQIACAIPSTSGAGGPGERLKTIGRPDFAIAIGNLANLARLRRVVAHAPKLDVIHPPLRI